MTATKVVAHVRLENGHLLSAANAHRIVARATTPTDRWGNRLDKDGRSPIYKLRNEPPYYQRWVIRKDKKGFIFTEVGSGSGICGYAPTVRKLVINTLCGLSSGIVIEVLDEALAQPAREAVVA
jgi:hypothetical protein